MYKNDVKCYATALDNYLEISTSLNKLVIDYLAQFHGSSNPELYKSLTNRSASKGNFPAKETYDFAKFITSRLNAVLNGQNRVPKFEKNNLLTHSYLQKEINAKEFEISFFEHANPISFTIKTVPKSKISRILDGARILSEKKAKEFIQKEKEINLSFNEIGLALDKEENIDDRTKKEQMDLAIKCLKLRHPNLFSNAYNEYSIVNDFFEDVVNVNKTYPLFTTVGNHILLTNVLLDINDKFENGEFGEIQENILNKLFIKNTLWLDAFRDLSNDGMLWNKRVWRSALSSLNHSYVPFISNVKHYHQDGFDVFLNNLSDYLENDIPLNSDSDKMKMLFIYRGLIVNLTEDKFFLQDILENAPLERLLKHIKNMGEIISNRQIMKNVRDSGDEVDVQESVVKHEFDKFKIIYPYNFNNLSVYKKGGFSEYTEVLNEKIEPLDLSNLKLKLTTEVNIGSFYDELGIERNQHITVLYMYLLSSVIENFFPVFESKIKNITLSKNELYSKLENYSLSKINPYDNLFDLNKFITILELSCEESLMNKEYVSFVVNTSGKLLNSLILTNLDKQANRRDYKYNSTHRYKSSIEILDAFKSVQKFLTENYHVSEKERQELAKQIRTMELNFKINKVDEKTNNRSKAKI